MANMPSSLDQLPRFLYLYMTNGTTMEVKHQYTVEEVVEIVNSLSVEDKEKVIVKVQETTLNEKEILDRISPFHNKFEKTYKALA